MFRTFGGNLRTDPQLKEWAGEEAQPQPECQCVCGEVVSLQRIERIPPIIRRKMSKLQEGSC